MSKEGTVVGRAILVMTALAAATAAIGCGGGPVKILVRGVEPLNVNAQGESTPVDVRIYFLTDDGKFKKAVFEDLWVKDKEVLGDNMAGDPKQITIYPGKKEDKPKEIQLGELKPEVRFIGVMALYSKGKGEQRHVAVPRDEADDYVFEFTEFKVKFKP